MTKTNGIKESAALVQTTVRPSAPTAAADNTFAGTFTDLLGAHSPTQNVSEEDLFAGVIGLKLKTELGDEVYDDYRTALKLAMTETAPGRSGPSCEYAARQAMHYLVVSNTITVEQSRAIRQFSREAAQLDEDRNLFDSISGGPDDTTQAITTFSEAETLVDGRMAVAPTGIAAAAPAGSTTTPTVKTKVFAPVDLDASLMEPNSENYDANLGPKYAAPIETAPFLEELNPRKRREQKKSEL